MIAKLRGRLDSVAEEGLVLDVGGIGYFVHCAPRLRDRLPALGETVSLLIETQLREDSITLYGFLDVAEREWFRLLQTVQGVGARLALTIIGTLGAEELTRAVAAQDRATLARASGVGQRLATRIATELRDRAPAAALSLVPMGGPGAASAGALAGSVVQDAISALMNLGYRQSEAAAAVGTAQQRLGAEAPLAELIRGGLKELTQ